MASRDQRDGAAHEPQDDGPDVALLAAKRIASERPIAGRLRAVMERGVTRRATQTGRAERWPPFALSSAPTASQA